MFDPISSMIGKGLRKILPDKVGEVMGTFEDPFQLHRSGYFQSPWTNMQRVDEKEKAGLQKQNMNTQEAYNSAFGNPF